MSVNIHNATIRIADLLDDNGRFNMNLYSTTYTGVQDLHSYLQQLDFDSSGHTGFTSTATTSGLDTKIDTTSGTLQSTIDQNDANVFHTNVPAEVSGLSAKGAPAATDYLLLEDSADSFNKKKVAWSSLPGSAGGEVNTASNLGAGEGVFYQKTGVDLEFKSVVGGDNISLTSDNNIITISGGAAMETHGNEYHSPDFATAAGLSTATADIAQNTSDIATNSGIQDAHESDSTIHFTEASIDKYTQSETDALLNDKYDKVGGTISGDVTIHGDLTVSGTKFIANVEEVLIEDNLLVLNYGEPGAGVTASGAGIEIDRGSETNYQFMFIEADDNFQIGISGSLQAVATREGSPTDTYVPYWNDSQTRFDTAGSSPYSDIASNTTHKSSNGSDHGYIDQDVTSGSTPTFTATNITGGDIHTQGTDTSLGSGAVAADHGTAATDEVVNVCYGTGSPPTASTTTEGALFIKYIA